VGEESTQLTDSFFPTASETGCTLPSVTTGRTHRKVTYTEQRKYMRFAGRGLSRKEDVAQAVMPSRVTVERIQFVSLLSNLFQHPWHHSP